MYGCEVQASHYMGVRCRRHTMCVCGGGGGGGRSSAPREAQARSSLCLQGGAGRAHPEGVACHPPTPRPPHGPLTHVAPALAPRTAQHPSTTQPQGLVGGSRVC